MLVKILVVTFVLAISALPSVFSYSREANAVSRAKIQACRADYYALCSDYTKMPEIIKCFKSKWHQVSNICKETN